MLTLPPETVLFALDLDQECALPVGRNWCRLDVIKHAITNFVRAKRWASPAHNYGLITIRQDTCTLQPLGVTSNVDRFLEALQDLQPGTADMQHPADPLLQQQYPGRALDLGSLIATTQHLQPQGRSAEPVALHGGLLMQLNSSSSSRSGQQSGVRVVLVYCRSRLPAPVWHTHQGSGLALDCLHIHDKPQPGEQQQQLQEVYSQLESLVDKMALKAGHASLIYESTAKSLGKLLSCMALLASHPLQRRSQAQAQSLVDLALADLQPLPSDAANLASGVPIMPAAKLPAAVGAWVRPLSAGSTAAAGAGAGVGTAAASGMAGAAASFAWSQQGDSSSAAATAAWDTSGVQDCAAAYQQPQPQDEAAPSAPAAASGGIVTGVPIGCVQGIPDQDAPAAAMDLDAGVVLGLDMYRSSSTSSTGAGPAAASAVGASSSHSWHPPPADAGAGVAEEHDELVQSLRVSAPEKDMTQFYPKIG